MSEEWKIEDSQPDSMGNFSIVTKSEIQTQVAVAVTEDIAVGIVRDHNASAALVEALEKIAHDENTSYLACPGPPNCDKSHYPTCPVQIARVALEEAK